MKSHGRLTAAPCPVIRLIPPLGTDIVPMANAEKATSLRLQQPPPLLSGSSRPVGKWYGSGSVAIAAMVWYEGSDDWQRQFDSNDRISAQNENQPYLTNLANLTGSHHMVNEVESFMLVSHQASDIGDRHVERVQSLIEGDNSRSAITCPNVPVIWVWDLNCYPDRPRPHGSLAELSFGKKLSTEEFFELLRKERLPDSVGRTNSPLSPRRVYINNPSGDEIQELIRRIPPSQAEGFRELLTKYVHNKPQPHFGLRECTRWNQAFSFLFNCPYYALTTEDVEDRRTISNGRRSTKMRSRESLDFLYPSHYLKKNRHIRNQKSPGEARYIHDVVSSALITGQSDSYWTCFLFNEDMCLDPERQRLQADDELEEEGGTTDPITMTEQTAASLKPRVYGLQALVFQLDTIIRQQESIAECFEDSLVRFVSLSGCGSWTHLLTMPFPFSDKGHQPGYRLKADTRMGQTVQEHLDTGDRPKLETFEELGHVPLREGCPPRRRNPQRQTIPEPQARSHCHGSASPTRRSTPRAGKPEGWQNRGGKLKVRRGTEPPTTD
ncbi:hypothetical protein FSOLCH5_001605 [Fusarium solani]